MLTARRKAGKRNEIKTVRRQSYFKVSGSQRKENAGKYGINGKGKSIWVGWGPHNNCMN